MRLASVGCVRVKFWYLCQALTEGDLAIAIYRNYMLRFWHLCQALTDGDLAIAIYRTVRRALDKP